MVAFFCIRFYHIHDYWYALFRKVLRHLFHFPGSTTVMASEKQSGIYQLVISNQQNNFNNHRAVFMITVLSETPIN